MEAILAFKIKNEQKFYDSALKVGYNELEIYKFIYVMQQSDLDIFPKMHDERLNVLLYGWELCEDYKQHLNADEWELPEELETILKLLMPWSMDVWFSKEWDKCKSYLKSGLIYCLNRGRDLLMRMPDMMQINWDFLLQYSLTPWNVPYLKNLTVTRDKTLETGAQSIETEELPATNEDISYVKLEQLPLIVLRLVKLFDQSSIDMVKTLCMRVIAAWNKIYQTELETSGRSKPYVPPEDKRCLLLICHIYLMAVYEADDVKGYVIDNMINNIRFYYQGFQNSTALYAMDNLEYTPARFIALTNIHLRVQKRDFFDFFIWNKYDTSTVNLFGVVSQAYKSYLLGNLLMELNNMNEDDFAANIPLYKRLMNSYVNERERSELFLLNEMEKLELQHYAHNILPNIKSITDFKSKICKGNRMSNIGNYENSDDTVLAIADAEHMQEVEKKVNVIMDVQIKEEAKDFDEFEEEENSVKVKENELRLDPIFQNMPNNENILYYVYEVLAKKDYKGWHFAKIVLLMKIIDHELNMIETWRYHPGLTTEFMLNLEIKLSKHYVDLAKIFKDHALIEQEFWLTAFYLNPTPEIYETIKRLGMRNNRKRTEDPPKMVMTIDNVEAKYGLLSSTIDVKEIANLANTDDPDTDYYPLYSVLHSLRVPDSLVKDMITAIFLPRNKSFAWVVDWSILRTRCKMIMNSMQEKKRFVELNMAEANDRLKYLIIDYEKYKNRPQLDYGTIEEGYENLMNSNDFDKDTDEEEEEEDEEEDFEDDEDIYESQNKIGKISAAARKKEAEKIEDDNSQEDDPFLMGKRRTRARTAATLATILFQTLPGASRRRRNAKEHDLKATEDNKTKSHEENNQEKSSESKSPLTTSETAVQSPLNAGCDTKDSNISNLPTKNIKEYLRERPAFSNSTHGFRHLIDIWNVEKTELQTIDDNCVSLLESSNILQRAVKWKSLSKEINPLGCNEQEHIDETELVIENVEAPIKREYNFNMVTACMEEDKFMLEKVIESATPMEVDDNEKEVESQNVSEQHSLEIEPVTFDMVVDEEGKVLEYENSAEQESKEVVDVVMKVNAAEQESKEVVDVVMKVNEEEDNVLEDKNVTAEEAPIENAEQQAHIEKVPDERLSEKEQIQETPYVEDYSESIISDLSTEAIKDSGEISESNTETNSKRNSFNYDIEVEDKIELNQKVDELDDTIKDNEIKETELEYKNNEEEKLELPQQSDKDEQEKCKESEVNHISTISETMDKETEETKNLDKFNESDELTDKNEVEKLQVSTENDISKEINDNDYSSSKDYNNATPTKECEELNDFVELTEENIENINNVTDKEHPVAELDTEAIKSVKDDTESSQGFQNNDLPSIESKTSKEKQPPDTLTSDEDTKTLTSDDKEETSATKALTVNCHNNSLISENDSNICLHYSTIEEEDVTVMDKTDNENKTHSPLIVLDESTADSSKTTLAGNSTDSETRNLKSLCLTKNAKILIRKLRAEDLTNLRQPQVKLKRVNFERYAEEFRTKRRRVIGKVYLNLDDDSSSNSYGTNTSSSDTYRPPKQKRKIPIRRHNMRHPTRTSDSDNDSNTSEDMKLSTTLRSIHERRLSTHSTSQSSTKIRSTQPCATGPKSARQRTAGPKSSKTSNLVVTPRSASGLKLRISNANEQTSLKTIVCDDVIQLSSSSSEACIINDLSVIEEEVIEIEEDNPLFEEEIII